MVGDLHALRCLFMLDPGLLDPASSGQLPFPSVAKVLSGGETIFPDLDLGYGPAQIVDESAMKNSIPEFEALDFETMLGFATNEMVGELLMIEINEEEFRQYHWAYLQ